MPLTAIQRRVMETLAPFRSRQTYVAGGAALNRQWPRLSDDLDIFGDQRVDLHAEVEPELKALRAAGLTVDIKLANQDTVEVIVREYGFETRVQWANDVDAYIRFFPAVADDDLGFRLHQADNSVNKVLCAAHRQQAARDAVDLALIVERYAPVGSLVWAAAGKAAAINRAQSSDALEENPIRLIRYAQTNAFGYGDEEIRTVAMEGEHRLTRDHVRRILGPAFEAARVYCEDVAPVEFDGHLFVDQAECPVEADAESLAREDARAVPISDFGPVSTVI